MIDNQKDINIEEQSAINFKDLLYLCLSKWYWFAMSVFLCVCVAVLYICASQPVYTRSASVLIKDDSKGKSISNELDAFSNLGLFSSTKNVVDEIGAMQSRDVFREMVTRLSLDVNYSVSGFILRRTIYGEDLPIVATFPNLGENTVAFRVKLLGEGRIKVFDLSDAEGEYDYKAEGKLGDDFNTPVGVIHIAPSSFYDGTEDEEIAVAKTPIYKLVDRYQKLVSIARGEKESNIINLSIKDVSIKRGDDILGTIIAVYNEGWIEDKNKITVSTSQFINSRLGIIEQELGGVDSEISDYKSENQIPDLEEVAKIYLEQVKESNKMLQELNDQAYMAKYILTQLSSDGGRFQPLPANSGLSNTGIMDQIKSYNEAVLDRSGLVARSSVSNPIVVQLDVELGALRSALVRSVENELVAIESQISTQKDVSREVSGKLASNPNQAKYLVSVERQQKVKESLYLYLLQKREENELSQAFIAYNTRVLAQPGGSLKPTAPIKRNVLLIAFVLGVLIPLGIIFLEEVANTKIRGRKDLESLTVPLVGEIPAIVMDRDLKKKLRLSRKKVSRINTLVVKEGNRDVINEAFRVLRTNIEFMVSRREGSKTEVIMFTSFNPGSGKSFIAVNTAMVLAIRNIRVLVIDGDLRHASTSAYVDSPSRGLSDFLSGRVDDVHDVIKSDSLHKSLSILPVGTIPPNPSELLLSEMLPTMLETLKGEYDYIFFDCPPIEMFADAQIISKLSDRTLFIVRAGLLEKAMLPELEGLYTEKKFKNMSVILNGTENVMGHYGSGYRYGYKYGYGYGSYYGSDGKNGGGSKWLDNK